MTYTIKNQTNRIMAHRTADDATVVIDAETFTSEAELSELAANWPGARLIEIWSSLPGVTAVKKFKDRATAVGRIWKAIQQSEEATVPEALTEPENDALAPSAPEATKPPDHFTSNIVLALNRRTGKYTSSYLGTDSSRTHFCDLGAARTTLKS